MLQADYSEMRSQIRAGDMIAFGGKGRFSNIIKFATMSPVSHVGVILETKVSMDGDPQDGRLIQIIESTSLDGFSGVQTSRFSARLAQYNGRVWWLPLSDEARAKLDLKAATDWALCQYKKPYDALQAVLSAIPFLPQPENYKRLFCSELVCGYYEAGGVLPKRVNASTTDPMELCGKPIFAPNYSQLKGTRKEIPNYGRGRLLKIAA